MLLGRYLTRKICRYFLSKLVALMRFQLSTSHSIQLNHSKHDKWLKLRQFTIQKVNKTTFNYKNYAQLQTANLGIANAAVMHFLKLQLNGKQCK